MSEKTPVLESDAEEVMDREDYSYQRKTVSTWIVELFVVDDAGGYINLWQKGESTLEHIWTPAVIDGEDYKLADQVSFWDRETAKAEYRQLTSVSAITDLMWRNR